MNYTGSTSTNYGKIFDNVGWVRGTKSVNGEWGAYLWVVQNRIAFQASTSAWWSTTNGIPVAISNVMVGSLGDYQATSNVVDIGPKIPTNYPGANQSDSETYQVDITNVYYELVIPDIWIMPRFAVTCIGGSNVQYTVTGTNIPQGVTWSLIPDLSGSGGATIPSSNAWQAEVTPGNVGTNYKVRARSVDNTNFYDQVDLTVVKVDILETNMYIGVSNTVSLHLTPDSSLLDAEWEIIPDLQGGAYFEGSESGTSVVINAGSLPTNYTVKAYASAITNCFDTCTVTVCKVEFITPAGDPTNAPVESGDGQNEFTFSTNSPGVLEINLKATVAPTGVASQIVSRCQFSIGAIGNSTLAWDSANPSGTPIVSNDFLLAKVTFTGLPANNAAFGSKKATVCFNTTKQDEKPYEVFFAKWGYNNPVGGTNNPNWFYYWKEGGVCGIGTNCVFVKRAGTWGYTQPWNDSIIRLCDLAPEANNGPQTFYSYRANEGYGEPTNGSITVTGQGKGINCVAETIQHESEHIYIYETFNGQTDGDWDGIPNSQETTNSATSYGGIASDLATSDTYNIDYGTYSDQELRCRKKEMIQTINVYTNLDWANPGFQSKDAYGP